MTITSLTDFSKYTTIDNYTLVPLQQQIFAKGKLVYQEPTLAEKRTYCEEQMNKLYPEIRRITNPHVYYVDGSERYIALKKNMIEKAGK